MGKTARKILFDFDSLFDTQIGFVRFMQLHCIDILADWAKDISLKDLCKERMKRRNFSLSCIKVDRNIKSSASVQLASEIFDEAFEKHYDELISLSPKVPQTKQIISIYDTPEYSNFMDCHLLARYQKEVDVLKKEFPNHPIFLVNGNDKFNYSQYARVFIGSYAYIWHMKGIEFTKITVLSYPDNFELIKDNGDGFIRKINSEALTALGDTNLFELLEIQF